MSSDLSFIHSVSSSNPSFLKPIGKPKHEVLSTKDLKTRLSKLDCRFEFACGILLERNIAEFKADQYPKLKCLKAAHKTLQIFLILTSLLISFSFLYAPLWVPLGIGIPFTLLLALIAAKMKQVKITFFGKEEVSIFGKKIDLSSTFSIPLKESQYESLLAARKAFKEHSFKAIHPDGMLESEVDPRLLSDYVMKIEIENKDLEEILQEPIKKSTKEIEQIERVLGVKSHTYEPQKKVKPVVDLEVSPAARNMASMAIVQLSNKEAVWGEIKTTAKEAKEEILKDNFKGCAEKITQATLYGYLSPALGLPLEVEDIPYSDLASSVGQLVRKFFYINLVKKQAEKKYGDLNKVYIHAPKQNGLSDKWDALCQKYEHAKKCVTAFKKLGTGELWSIERDTWEMAAVVLHKENLFEEIPKLLAELQHFQKECVQLISLFPENRLKTFEEKLNGFTGEALSDETFKALGEHVLNKATLAQKALLEIGEWRKSHPSTLRESLKGIYERNKVIKEALSHASLQLGTMKKEWDQKKDDPKFFKEICNDLDIFEKNTLVSLKETVDLTGLVTFGEMFRKAVLRKAIPLAKPFEEIIIPKDELALPQMIRHRKIDQKNRNEMLKSLDRKMVYTNRARRYGVSIILMVAYIAEAILFTYFSNPWIIAGFATGTTLFQLVSLYIDDKLKDWDAEKQDLKICDLLKDRTETKEIPIQGKYGLDGVHLTWSKSVGKPEDKPQEIVSKEEAKFARMREAGPNIEFLHNFLYTTSSIPHELKIEEMLEIQKEMRAILKTALESKGARTKSTEDLPILETVVKKVSEKASVDAEIEKLKTLPKPFLRMAARFWEQVFDLYVSYKIVKVFEEGTSQQIQKGISNLNDPKKLFKQAELEIGEKGEVSEKTASMFACLSPEGIKTYLSLYLLRKNEIEGKILHAQRKVSKVHGNRYRMQQELVRIQKELQEDEESLLVRKA